jgi:hypothetical protein
MPRHTLALLLLALALAGCAGMAEPEGAPRKETIYAVTEGNALVHFNAGQPRRLLGRRMVAGLQPGETLLGIDYRVARGVLFGLGSSGRLYTLNAQTGAATQVGQPLAARLEGSEFGFDFNPVVDRIRVVSDSGLNLRLHPDTGALVQPDGKLAYAATDRNAGNTPRIMAAAYTYNKTNDKITTNFVIDGALGTLAIQGSREGATPAVSPNTGQLFTVGPLGTGPVARAAFDIADTDNAAFAALTPAGARASRLYLIDLETGAATLIGTIAAGEAIRGIAIEP